MGQENEHRFLKKLNRKQNPQQFNLFNFTSFTQIIKSVIENEETALQTKLLELNQHKELEENKFILITCAITKWTSKLKAIIDDKIYFLQCVAEPHKHPHRSINDIKEYELLIPIYTSQAEECANIIDDLKKQQPIIEERLNNLAKETIELENHLSLIYKQKNSMNILLNNQSLLDSSQNIVITDLNSHSEQNSSQIDSIQQRTETQFKRRP